MALRNATKVAFGAFAVGCGGVMTTATQPAPDAHVELDASAQPEKNETLACTAPVDVDASDVSADTFQCCVADLKSVVGDAQPWGPDGIDAGLVGNDPSAANCCKAIIARIDDEPDGGNMGDDYGAAASLLPWCCSAVQSPPGVACTPWGPPTPPEMGVA